MPIAFNADRRFKRDDKSKAISYYCVDKAVLINQELIDSLCIESAYWGRRNIRICMHRAPTDNHHEMIILEREGHYFPPHRHFSKGETLHIIEGELGVIGFDSVGNITFSTVLGRDGDMIAHFAPDQWHLTIPINDPVIYHESKPGPFLGDDDRAFAFWAPRREDKEAGLKYIDEIRKGLE